MYTEVFNILTLINYLDVGLILPLQPCNICKYKNDSMEAQKQVLKYEYLWYQRMSTLTQMCTLELKFIPAQQHW